MTRRTTRRTHLLRPDEDGTSQSIYWYTTAVYAQKFDIIVHAVQVLATHMHEVVTDVNGRLPDFVRERNRILANALKCHRGWPEEVFQRSPATYVELYGPEALTKQIAYTLANCVEAGLVNDPSEYPGVTVLVDDIGELVITVERPSVYFDPTNPIWPERASIKIQMPQCLTETYGDDARNVLRRAVSATVERARAAARKAGKIVRGAARRLTKGAFTKRSRSYEPFGTRNPTFATGGNKTQAKIALAARAAFQSAYRTALAAFRSGVRDVVFPNGTWRMRQLFGVAVAQAPP